MIFEKALRHILVGAFVIKGKLDVSALMKNAKKAREVNEKLLMKIIRKNQNTEYGKKYNFSSISSIEEFQQNVPFSCYEDYREYIDKIYNEDARSVLYSSKTIGFARSSGSLGGPKIIPMTDDAISIYTKYTVTRFLSLAQQYSKQSGKPMKMARGICALPRFVDMSPCGLPATNVADVTARKFHWVYPYGLNLPIRRQFTYDEIDDKYAQSRFGLEDKDTLFMFSVFSKTLAELILYIRDNWQLIVDDIEKGTINPSIRVKPEIKERLLKTIKPNPKRAAELRMEFEKGFDKTIISRVWPNMRIMSSIGTSPVFEPFTEIIKSYTEGIVFDYSMYGASEGLFAATYKNGYPGQLMLPDSCFYEFIEMDDADEGDDSKILLIDELEVGKKYEMIITNQMGFYRYRFNDIIKIIGFEGECPVIEFAYRKGQLLNVTGEKTNFLQMSEAMRLFAEQTGTDINSWCVFVDKGIEKYRYGVMIESNSDKDLSQYADLLDKLLCEVNDQYVYYGKKSLIEPPVIFMLRLGAQEDWKEYKIKSGASPSQIKPVYILDTDEKKQFFMDRLR